MADFECTITIVDSTFYTDSEFLSFIEKVFGSYQPGRKNIQVLCPECSIEKGPYYTKRKLSIKLGRTHLVNCWVCGYRSRNLAQVIGRHYPEFVSEYIQKFLEGQNLSLIDNEDESDVEQKLDLPSGFNLLATASANKYAKKMIDYLIENRGIPKTNIEKELWYWKFGYTDFNNEEYRGRIIIPSFDGKGELNYYVGRHIYDKKPKYQNPSVPREDVVFNESNINWKKTLTIVEGPFDLIKCNENATCLLGSDLDFEYRLMQKIILNQTPVVLALDPDAWKKTVDIAKKLESCGITVKVLDIPKRFKDVGDMNKEQFAEALAKAQVVDDHWLLKRSMLRIVA